MKSFLLFLWFSCLSYSLSAQLVPACAGGSTATSCATACINCNFNGYFGSTAGFPSGIVPNFCGTVENAQWMGFIAGAGEATFTVTPSNCAYGDGLQMALYEDCTGEPLECVYGEMNGGNLPVSLTVGLAPGHNYFLMIDGFAGDQCDFTVNVTPNSAVYEPPLGQVGQLTGPTEMCPGATMPFSLPPVYGAGAYIWSGPAGAMIDSVPLPVTVTGANGNQVNITMGNVGGAICVQAANSCSQTAPCSASLNIQILDDSYRPAIQGDTLQHLTCTGEPAQLLVTVPVTADYDISWQADSTGNIVSGANSLKPRVDQPGVYSLLVTNNLNGCSSSLAVRVGDPDTPRVTGLDLSQVTCFGFNNGEARVAEISGGRTPHLVSLDGAPLGMITVYRNLEPGQHTLEIESSDGCMSDTSFWITEPDPFMLDLGPDISVHLGQSLSLMPTGGLSDPDRVQDFVIKPEELQEMLCDTCRYSPLNSFHYTLTAVDSAGCTASDDRIVAVSKDRYVYVPEVFKPDAEDTANAHFQVFGGEDVAKIIHFRVVSRWGALVHERNDYMPGDESSAWDGTINGEPATPAVFTWQARILFKDGVDEWRSGTVTVVR
ncbi:MAG TPA: hypothetical protein VK168_07115 [Saprospiraceae bacterium]|nr:hypothetical protein [Saprospiraceae bacterium]